MRDVVSLIGKEIGDGAKPKVGDRATEFTLNNIDGQPVELSKLLGKSPIVLVVLRGYPGYQCPICTRQVADLMSVNSDIQKTNARVLLVYPGPAANLDEKAKEFFAVSVLPDNVTVLLDPDYKFTNAYHLRWDAPKETAYPTTMVLNREGLIKYVEISDNHGGRSSGKTVVGELQKL